MKNTNAGAAAPRVCSVWVKGIAGAGKSTLLRHALGRIKALHSAGEAPLVLDFFFDRQGDALQKSTLGLFRSLLHQVLTWAPRTLAAFVDAFRQRSAAEKTPPDDAAKWPEGDLKAALRSSLAAALQERPVWLLVDALDESGDEATAVGIVDEFKALLDGVSADGFPLRIILTARQHLKLDSEYRFEVAVQSNNAADIAAFVAARLSTDPFLKESIIGELITKRAGGLFLWAALVVDKVHAMRRASKGLRSIQRMIHDTPAKLAALYRQMLDELTAEERPLTRKLFQWMCFAKRPLKVDELKWALIVGAEGLIESCTQFEDHDEFDSDMATRIVYISRGLVKTESEWADSSPSAQHFVRFIHQSVVDFLLREGGLASMHDGPTLASADIAQHAHYQLSRTCIRYLRMKKIAQLPAETLQEWAESGTLWSTFPLFEYASVAWPSHTQRGYQHRLVSSMGWPSDPFFNRWLRIYCRVWSRKLPHIRWIMDKIKECSFLFRCPPENINVGHFAAQHGLTELLLEALPPRGRVAVDTRNNFGRTPLFYAALNGYGRLVAALLNAGADPCVRDHRGRDALSFAAQFGHADVASDLLSKGAGVNARDSAGITALHWAALGQDQDTMRLLLRRGADVGAKARNGSTPLEWAIVVGHEAGVATLLAAGSAVNYSYREWSFTDSLDSWVNCVCEEKGTLDIYFIDRGTRMWTPLSLAVRKGIVAIVKLLLDKGASPDLAAESGSLPLSLARELGNEEMISLLEARASKSKELSIMLGSNATM
ncbi:Fibronectin type 3 and ankyrin repeat domains prot ein 1 [Beauveria bassiana D1-5]|uniref:Fibronectin type 3 and ankyrin repeat domains prot ein 1 n=1 Tax=Beauveria bassiana D1-5 TaxID=1245745 RepID=A0A0A2VRZ9_BEABA|nr:Fibronectin type 3 and ankyrin repeat domains prot ein 1 [Beauveria bassiana D1-5]